ncbi:leucine-rich repeat domain-containing protein [Niabella pedocola]|uniref:Leucine-rich repeat domain-containing protein n=1 Tax=Niabella pedocola TaxID=1752077 RepID=A0ABS8PWK0_9BACT|nr:leucine-rich repeat domain-containing protein [Niabella pedocola]MCD2425457.1 leucine-rich repeat domain-containing protein [Niabella pedocola]
MFKVCCYILLTGFLATEANAQAWGYVKDKPVYRNLDSAYRNRDAVYNLELSHRSIIPEKLKWIGDMPNLTFLFLSGDLSYLPEEIFKLKKIRRLALWGDFDAIPEGIRHFEDLEILSMPSNRIRAVPAWIGELKKLKGLYLGRNGIENIPDEIANCTMLEHLSLDENRLDHLPESLVTLPHLKKLDLGSNRLTRLPEGIASLKKLTRLSVPANQLTAVPNGIVMLEQLDTLVLSGNRLSQLPAGLHRLHALKLLDVSFNPIANTGFTLPASLKRFVLVNSQLRAFPEALKNCRQLEELQLVQSQIQMIPEWITALPNLKKLDLSGNQLVAIPAFICRIKTLESLDLANNRIDTITGLLELPALKRLDLSRNPIRNAPGTWTPLPSLRYLNISGTGISLEDYKRFRKKVGRQTYIMQDLVHFNEDEQRPCYPENASIIDATKEADPVNKPGIPVPEIFTKAEMLPRFIKGDSAMVAFFNRHLIFPDFNIPGVNSNSFTDTVLLRFVVTQEGRISGITLLTYKTVSAKAEAVRLTIQSCSYWRPAIQGGREVKAYRKIAFIFRQFYEKGVLRKTLLVERWPY